MIGSPVITVIIPIYNAAKYLEDALQSVVMQTIGFEDNIHVVLINDGSTDSSEAICKKYTDRYPNNIEYIYQENSGAATARNTGLELVRGKYINLLDADDKWELDAFEKALSFFDLHYDEIDIVACRVKYFGRESGYGQALDYKFIDDFVCDINEHFDFVQLFTNSIFLKSSAVGKIRYNTETSITEDVSFVTKILVEKQKYGILRSVNYLYRKNEDESSLVDKKLDNFDWYITVPQKIYPELFNLSIEKFGMIIPYVQYLVASDARWKIFIEGKLPDFMQDKYELYYSLLKDTFDKIDDEIWASQKSKRMAKLAYCLKFKNESNYDSSLILNRYEVRINSIEEDKENFVVMGRDYSEYLDGNYSVCLKCDEKIIELAYNRAEKYDFIGIDGNVAFEGRTFEARIPKTQELEYCFVIKNKVTGSEQNLKIVDARKDNKNIKIENNRLSVIKKKLFGLF